MTPRRIKPFFTKGVCAGCCYLEKCQQKIAQRSSLKNVYFAENHLKVESQFCWQLSVLKGLFILDSSTSGCYSLCGALELHELKHLRGCLFFIFSKVLGLKLGMNHIRET